MKPAPKPVKSQLPEVEEISRQVCDMARAFNPFASGVMCDFTIVARDPPTVQSGATYVRHGLGRKPQGVIFTSLHFPFDTVGVGDGESDSSTILLYASQPCSGKVWIY
jgi:hypothetical protein